MDRRTTLAKYIPSSARLAAVGLTALAIGLVDQAASYLPNSNSSVAMASEGPKCSQLEVSGQENDCQREVRIAYLAGVYKPGEAVTAAVPDRTADINIDGITSFRMKVGSLNNSAVAEDANLRRSIVVGGLELNYAAIPVGLNEIVTVNVHRLNIDGSRRTDADSNPPAKDVDTCVVKGGPDLHTLTGLNTIQVFFQNSALGAEYKNSKGDLVFQGADRFFQGSELGYLLSK